MKVSVSGVWKDSYMYARVAGTWKASTYGYVKVSGTWRKFYRRKDLFNNSTVVLTYSPDTGLGDSWSATPGQNGSITPSTIFDGRAIHSFQISGNSDTGYTRIRAQLLFLNDITSLNYDIPSLTFGGIKSTTVEYSNSYVSAFNVTMWRWLFPSLLPVSGSINMYF